MLTLIIGNKNYSSWSLRPWLLLSHFQIPFEEVRIPLYQPGSQAALAKRTPAGKVPVLQDGELMVWDSLAICEYLSEQYLQGGGWPDDPAARAIARSVSAEMHSGFPLVRSRMPMNCRAQGRRIATDEALQAEISRVDRRWEQLRTDNRNKGPWLFGEFSIADCMYAPVATRMNTYGIELSAASRAYLEQVLGHRAMRAWFDAARAEVETIAASEVGSTKEASRS